MPEPKDPKAPKDPKPKEDAVRKPARKAAKPVAVKKPQHATNPSAVANGKRPVGQDDEEDLPDADEDDENADGEGAAGAEKFCKERERARFGVINDVQLSKRTRVKDGLIDRPTSVDIAPSVPSREQLLLESFFIPLGSDATESANDALAQRRIDYVKPYTQSPGEAKKKSKGDRESLSKTDWRILSLKHRLNVIEGLQEIEDHKPKTPTEAWEELKPRARVVRKKLVEGQNWLVEPTSWEDYNDTKAARKPRKRAADPENDRKKDDDDDDDDEDDGSGGPGPSTTKTREEKDTEKKKPKKTRSVPNVWTDEHQTYLEQLEAGTQEDEDSEEGDEEYNAEPEEDEEHEVRPPYTWLELEMSERFINARNGNRDGPPAWQQTSKNAKDLARAHELFFRRWPLVNNKKGKPHQPRQGHAMVRKLGPMPRFKAILGKKLAAAKEKTEKDPEVASTKAATSSKDAKVRPRFGEKRVPDGKDVEIDDDDDDDDTLENSTNQDKQKLNAGNLRPPARKGPAKSTMQVEEAVQNGGQNADGDSDEESGGDGSSDVEKGGQGDEDNLDGSFDNEDIQEEEDPDQEDQDMEDQDGEGQGDGDQDDDSPDSSGSDDIDSTRH